MKTQTQQLKEERELILRYIYKLHRRDCMVNPCSCGIDEENNEREKVISQSLDRLENQVRQETIEEIYSKSKELTTICPYGNAHKARLAEGELMAVMIIKDKLSVSEEK